MDITGFQDIQPPPQSINVEIVINPETAEKWVALYFEYPDEERRVGFPIATDTAERVANFMLDQVRRIRSS